MSRYEVWGRVLETEKWKRVVATDDWNLAKTIENEIESGLQAPYTEADLRTPDGQLTHGKFCNCFVCT